MGLYLPDVLFGPEAKTSAVVLEWIKWLPDDSAYFASVTGGRERVGWGMDRTIQTAILNNMVSLNYSFAVVNTPKGKSKPKKPNFLDVPKVKLAEQRRQEIDPEVSARNEAAFLAAAGITKQED